MLVLEGVVGSVDALAFHPDGRRVAGGGGALGAALWDVATGGRLAEWPAVRLGSAGGIQFHPSGAWLFAAWGRLLVVDCASGAVTETEHEARAAAFAPAGDRAVTTDLTTVAGLRTSARPPTREWATAVDPSRRNQYSKWWSRQVAFLPDGERFASVESRTRYRRPPETRVRVRSAADGSVVAGLRCPCWPPDQMAVSPDGAWVALRTVAAVWLLATSGPVGTAKVPSPNRKNLTGMAFHPGGRYLAVTANDHTVRFHDRDADWAVTRTFDWDVGRLKSVAFSPDGTLAAAGGEKGRVVVWDVDG